MSADVEKWGVFETSFVGPSGGNPFVEVTIDVEFSRENRRVTAPGFYDGDGVYRVRFMPDTEGEWTYQTRANAKALDGLKRLLQAARPPAPAIMVRSGSAIAIISLMRTERRIFLLARPATPGRISR